MKFVSKKAVAQAIVMQIEVKVCYSVFGLIFHRFKPVFSGIENQSKNNIPLKWLF